jgi:transcription termination factor Rho
MSVLDRAALEESPLADLHAIASVLSIDGYRRLRRGDLIDAILERQTGGEPGEAEETEHEGEEPALHTEPEQGGEPGTDAEAAAVAVAEEEEEPPARRRRGRRGGRGRSTAREEPQEDAEATADAAEQPEIVFAEGEEVSEEGEAAEEQREDEEIVEGVVELLTNGSGFLRVEAPEASDNDVYISAAQVKRCELVSGDRVSGPRRAPRRSERFASLIRVDTINGHPAAELISGARFEDLPATFPDQHLTFGSEDPTLRAIESLTPFGKGSRVTITGGPRAGKTEALRRIGHALAAREELQLSVALAGVRPEEISEWGEGPLAPQAAVSFAASSDAQDHAVELVIDQARRIAARGAHAVVLVDTLDGMHPHAARKALAAARQIADGGSLTVIATASKPLGGETTVIALDVALTATGRLPALDLGESGTLRPELLVGDGGAEAIIAARRDALQR